MVTTSLALRIVVERVKVWKMLKLETIVVQNFENL